MNHAFSQRGSFFRNKPQWVCFWRTGGFFFFGFLPAPREKAKSFHSSTLGFPPPLNLSFKLVRGYPLVKFVSIYNHNTKHHQITI